MLGGASLVMFGMTAMAGIEELGRARFKGTNNGLVVAISLALSVLPIATPGLFAQARLFLNSGIFLAAAAVILNILFNGMRGSASKEEV